VPPLVAPPLVIPPLVIPPLEAPLVPPVGAVVPPLPDAPLAPLEAPTPPVAVLVPPEPALPPLAGGPLGSAPPHATPIEIAPSITANRAPRLWLGTTTNVMRTDADFPPRIEPRPQERNVAFAIGSCGILLVRLTW
jgi:hypothetical protein